MLNHRQIKFVHEYCVDYNATQAYIRAGYSENGASASASVLLADPSIQAAIKVREGELATAANLSPQWVLERWAEIATADPQELMQLRRINCRNCHGYGHAYQWTQAEYAKATNDAIEKQKPAPDFIGGFGFDPKRAPNPACTECGGEGTVDAHFFDSRKVSAHGRKLFAGVKQTKDGIEVKVRDPGEALANISRYLGMTTTKTELSGPGGGAIGVVNLKASDFTDDQLAGYVRAKDIPDDNAE